MDIGAQNQRACTARDFAQQIVIETQSSSPSQSSVKSTADAGWMVETACL